MIKKFLFTFLMIICSTCAYSQIQRTFLGFTLGATKKTQVVAQFKTKRKKFTEFEVNKIAVRDVSFGGITWPTAYLLFYKNTLYHIDFFMSAYDVGSLDVFNIHWNQISQSLNKKYQKYVVKSDESSAYYSDMKTDLMIHSDYEHNSMGLVKYMSLVYYDRALDAKKEASDRDEL